MKTQFIINPVFIFVMLLIGLMPLKLLAQNDTTTNNHIYMFVPTMPSFPGNIDNYLSDHVQYPESAKNQGIKGTVNVTFIVNQNGVLSKIEVLSGVSPDLDSEAVQLVRSMPPWNPGMKDGKAVKVQYNLPIYIGPYTTNSTGESTQSQPVKQAPAKPKDTIFICRNGFYVDPNFGFGVGGPQFSGSASVTRGVNFKFGLGLGYMLPSKFGFSTGIQIQQFKFSYTYTDVLPSYKYNNIATIDRTTSTDSMAIAGYSSNVSYEFRYAQIPVLLRYISSQENEFGVYAEGGVLINYLLSTNISGTASQTQYDLLQYANANWYTYKSSSVNSQTISSAAQNPAKLTVSLHFTVGGLLQLSSKMSLVLGFSPNFGLMNAGTGSGDMVNFGTSKFYYYGNGNYGTFNSFLFEAKLLIKAGG